MPFVILRHILALRDAFGTVPKRKLCTGSNMATIVKTPSNTWKAVIRKNGWPTSIKTFRTKRDAEDRSRHTEDAMAHGTYTQRAARTA